MAVGLFVSFLASIFVIFNPALVKLIFQNNLFFWGLLGIELGLVWYLSARIMSLSEGTAKLLFLLYSLVNGITLSVIFFAFSIDSIVSIFLSTMLMFGALALYGAKTKRDLTGFGTFATFGLFGLVIALLVNIFLQNTVFDLILAWIGVIIFIVLTAYDVQKIKALSVHVQNDEDIQRASVMGALTLYLDFINLFLSLLRIFGKRR